MSLDEIKNAIEQNKCLYWQRIPTKYERIYYEKYTYWFDKKKMYLQSRILKQIDLDKIIITDERISQAKFSVEEKVAKRKVYNKQYRDMLKEIEILEKALELACENVCEDEFVYVEPSKEIIKKLIDFFKSKAKEKNEK